MYFSDIRVTIIGELRTTLSVTTSCSTLRRNIVTVIMEVTIYSATSAPIGSRRCNIAENGILLNIVTCWVECRRY
jgi:hypothetical protein